MKPITQSVNAMRRSALAAALAVAILAVPVATAEASGAAHTSAGGRTPAKVIMKQIKSLKREIAELSTLGTGLAEQVSALQAKTGALESRGFPTSLPPSGSAGGALTGSYPTPLLGPNTVGAANIADGSVGTAEIPDAAVTSADLALGSVGGLSLKGGAFVATSNGIPVNPNETKAATVTCPAVHGC